MDAIGGLFNTIFLIPLINLLIFLYKIFESVGLPGALGFAIIVLTIIIRMVLWPLTHAQLKSAQSMAALKPLLDELKKKHTDKMELQKAQMDLYKEHGINPAAGCLPTLIQLPILIALYQAIINVFPSGEAASNGLNWINSVLYNDWLKLTSAPDSNFFGLNLAAKPTEFATAGAILLSVPLVTAALTFIQSKMMLPAKPLKIYPSDSPKEVKEKESIEDTMASVQTSMVYMMPLMIGYFAFTFPVGLAIYWNMLTILGIVQQYLISGWGGMDDVARRFGINLPDRKVKPQTKVTIERKKK